jgi:hypothetical protein
MDKNPYEAPTHEEEVVLVADRDRRFKFDWLYLPLAWAVLLFILWTQHGMFSEYKSDIPTWAKVASTILTTGSIVVLAFSIRGWRLFIALPLIGYMVWIQYLVWTFYASR